MAKSVLELAVGTGQWDAGLKKAKNALDNFTQANGGLQSALNKDSKSMQTFVQMMGRMDSTAKTAKGQMNDYKGTIEQLTMQYNRLTDAQKKTIGQDYLHSIDQMKQKYQGVAQEVAKINQELKQTNELSAGTGSGGGGLFSGDKLSGMLQVFGGNVMTKIAGMSVGFVSEMGDMVKQGIELARAGEGIRIAFERLNKPGLLDNLREATHGTVTDLELMKAAVKFNDFKLPVEELGTMLAFAQQKAKDTGQSVDYMVDSIVTGLGRKSLMILDNLGLSATEIRDKMKETGDMTKAVGEIIREQMQKAGDYVETAADRATKANVELENAMTRLGETFQPLSDAANSMWTDIKIGALDLLNNVIEPLINRLTEAGRLRAQLANINEGTGTSQTRAGKDLAYLKYEIGKYGAGSDKIEDLYNRQRGRYIQQQNQAWRQSQSAHQKYEDLRQKGASQADLNAYYQRWQTMEANAKAWATVLKEYDEGAKKLMKPVDVNINTDKAVKGVSDLKKQLNQLEEQRRKAVIKGDNDLVENLTKQINTLKQNITYLDPNAFKTTTGKTTAEKVTWDANKTMLAATKATDTMPSVWAMIMENGKTAGIGDQGLRQMMGIGRKQFDLGRDITEKDYKKLPGYKDDKETKKLTEKISTLTSGLSSIASGLKSMGIDLPKEVDQVIGVIQGVTSVIEGVNAVISIFSTTAMSANTAALIANTAALYANAATNIIPFANGGVVHAAGGTVVGNTYSGDQIPAMLNAGEVVLNRAQTGNLASQLQGGMGAMQLSAIITGEQLRLVLNNNGRRTGRGEYVTTNFR